MIKKAEIKYKSYLPDDVSNIQDEFGVHTKIAEALDQKIRTADVSKNSLTIGLFGEWGTGKSVIVEKLREKLTTCNNVAFINIDVWKYNGIPLLRHILYEIATQGSKKVFKQSETDKLKAELEYSLKVGNSIEKYQSPMCKKFRNIYPIIIVISFVLTIVGIGWSVFSHNEDWVPSAITQVSIPSFLIALFGQWINTDMFKSLKEWVGDLAENVLVMDKTVVPTLSPEQFETEFDALLTKLSRKGISKYVIVFDNIDRCKGDFAYNVLSTIKTYMSKSHCIYIIPCDDAAIKHYLSKEYNNSEREQEAHRDFATEFLDKLFNTYFRIPLTNELSRDRYIEKCLSETLLKDIPQKSKVLQVLYYAYKGETPRQIKKYINDLISYYEIALKADENKEFLLDDIVSFAIMVSIKQMAPDFEKRLIDSPALIWNIVSLESSTLSEQDARVRDLFIKTQFVFPKNKSIRAYIFFEKTNVESELAEKMRDGQEFEVNDENSSLAVKILSEDQSMELFLQNDFNSIMNSISKFGVSDYLSLQAQNKNIDILTRAVKESLRMSPEYKLVNQYLSSLQVDDKIRVFNCLTFLVGLLEDRNKKVALFEKFSSLPNFSIVYNSCFEIGGLDFGKGIEAVIEKFNSDTVQPLSPQNLALFNAISRAGQYQYFNKDFVKKLSPLITYDMQEWRMFEMQVSIYGDVGIFAPKIAQLIIKISEIVGSYGLGLSSNIENIDEQLEYLASFSALTVDALDKTNDLLPATAGIKNSFSSYLIMMTGFPQYTNQIFALGAKLWKQPFIEQYFKQDVPAYLKRSDFLKYVCSDSDLLDMFVSSKKVFDPILGEAEQLSVILENTSKEWKIQEISRFIFAPINPTVIEKFFYSQEWGNEKDFVLEKLVAQAIISLNELANSEAASENLILNIISKIFMILEYSGGDYSFIDKGESVFKKIILKKYASAMKLIKIFKIYDYKVDFYFEYLLHNITEKYPITSVDIALWDEIAKEITSGNHALSLELLEALCISCINVANQNSAIGIGLSALLYLSNENPAIIKNFSEQLNLLNEKGCHTELVHTLTQTLHELKE